MISMRRLAPGVARRKGASASPVRSPMSPPSRVLAVPLTVWPTPRSRRRYLLWANGRRTSVPMGLLDCRAHRTHPEGWRDWPSETPATTQTPRAEGANSREMCGEPRLIAQWQGDRAKGVPMAASHLQCRECKTEYPLEALYVCERGFGPLEVAYAPRSSELSVAERRRHIQAGPQN